MLVRLSRDTLFAASSRRSDHRGGSGMDAQHERLIDLYKGDCIALSEASNHVTIAHREPERASPMTRRRHSNALVVGSWRWGLLLAKKRNGRGYLQIRPCIQPDMPVE